MVDRLRPGFSAALRQEVDSIISNPSFTRALTQVEFLRQLSDQTLLGDRGGLSQYALAVDGMGKPETFDPLLQSNVRVRASRLRMALERHYRLMQPSGGLCVFLKKGSYQLRLAPLERAYPQIGIATQPPVSSTHNSPQVGQLTRLRWFGYGSMISLALVATVGIVMHWL
jgi:hypothetical protein